MGLLEDITKIPLSIAESLFSKGYLIYIIIVLVGVMLYFIGKFNGWI